MKGRGVFCWKALPLKDSGSKRSAALGVYLPLRVLPGELDLDDEGCLDYASGVDAERQGVGTWVGSAVEVECLL